VASTRRNLPDVYGKVVMEGIGIDVSIEYSAFVKLLVARTVMFDDGVTAFCLFDLQMQQTVLLGSLNVMECAACALE
jgi:hypothetical protein